MSRQTAVAALLGVVFSVLVALSGCGWTSTTNSSCDVPIDDPRYDDPFCRYIRGECVQGFGPKYSIYCDAGADGGAEGGPGTDPQSAACNGVCIDNAPDKFDDPQPVWIGPNDLSVPTRCPDDVGSFGSMLFAELDAPVPSCPACVCGPVEGSCSPTPGQLLIRGASCNEPIAYTTDFNVPQSWDGSCTSEKALPAGATCPGGLCAKSVYASALPDPVENCKPDLPPSPSKPSGFPYEWKTVALSCSASRAGPEESCGEVSKTCDWVLPKGQGWRHCVRRDGGVFACESPSYPEQFVVYPQKAINDSRGCSQCQCKASGGICYGTLRIYEDGTCALPPLIAYPWSSESILCKDFAPPGKAIGSKEITDLSYVPGTCKAAGGFGFGTAEPEAAAAVTWCCSASE